MFFDVKNCIILVGRKTKATSNTHVGLTEENSQKIPFKKYQIKETDFRTKTATLTSPFYIDLTTGSYAISIISIYHENFYGYILSADYDEDTGLYNYQCQDHSRMHQTVGSSRAVGTSTVYRILQSRLTGFALDMKTKLTADVKEYYKTKLKGLKNIELYDQSLYKGNLVKGNPMKDKPKYLIKNKPSMDIIKAVTFGRIRFVDLWFDAHGTLHIDPLSKTDWENTGLVLTANTDRNFKFDTTNAITGVLYSGKGLDVGDIIYSKDLINLDLTAFFGKINTGITGHTDDAVTTTNSSSKTNAIKKNNTSNTPVSTNGNPFNNKAKKIIVSADRGGNPNFKDGIVKLLKKDGWSVTDLGIGSDQHSASYRMLSSKYAVNLTIYNGMCAGTIKETYDGWLKGKHEKYGVAHVEMWDTSHWTSKKGVNNPKGDWYHRDGDMSDYYLATAHDWNRGGSPVIKSVSAYFKKYKVLYCCGTTPAKAYEQFKAGGYAKMKGLY